MSGVRLSRAYLPAMIGRGWGRIVFVASESALNIPADMIPTASPRRRNSLLHEVLPSAPPEPA
jgi:NAD(P)-dependent dehydrogenase (short-subunit alcohol dehydrogenase family)